MARYTKKRARELKHDAFRDKTMETFDRLGDVLEGKGRSILYGIGALVLIGIAVWALASWRAKKSDEASRALGHAIEIADAPVTETPSPASSGPTFTNERDRAQRAIEEFQKVSAKYGGQTREISNYFIAANLLTVDRAKGISQLESLAKSSDPDIAVRSKFALASAYEADGKLDQAAALYKDLAQANRDAVPVDVANLRLALVYEKQGKKQEAGDLLFSIANNSRKAQDKDGKPLPPSSAARDAEKELEKLDPSRYSQLPPPAAPPGFPA